MQHSTKDQEHWIQFSSPALWKFSTNRYTISKELLNPSLSLSTNLLGNREHTPIFNLSIISFHVTVSNLSLVSFLSKHHSKTTTNQNQKKFISKALKLFPNYSSSFSSSTSCCLPFVFPAGSDSEKGVSVSVWSSVGLSKWACMPAAIHARDV